MAAFYPPDYLPFTKAIQDEPSLLARLDRGYGLAKRCRAVERHKAKGKLLDVGCATGDFLNAMARRGWEVWGVEVNPHAAAYARERFGLRVFQRELAEADFLPHYFDAITFWDALEHLPDPIAALARARALLREDGLLVISLPDLDSWEARLFGRYWGGLDMPRHLYVFNKATLGQALWAAGLEVAGTEYLTGRWHATALSLRFLTQEKVRDPKKRAWLAGLWASPWPRLFSLPYFWLAAALKKGSTMSVFARPAKRG